MDYGKRIHRLLAIITLVQTDRDWTPKRFAEHFDVSERTVYRDIDTLRSIGVPLDFDPSIGGYRINRSFHLPPVHLDAEEALALALLAEHVGGTDAIPFMRPAWKGLHKIESVLPAAVREELRAGAESIEMRTAPAMPSEGYDDVYERVRLALVRRRRLHCRYEAANSSRDDAGELFELEPYRLFFCVRAWYVIGARSDRDGLRCLKLNRFSKIEVTDRPYAIPDDFSLEGYLGRAWRMIPGDEDVEVEVRFDAEFAQTAADTRWHETQEVEDHPDGSCTMRFTVSGLEEICWWVLSMGPHCEVVHPPALRERVRELAVATVERYAATGAG